MPLQLLLHRPERLCPLPMVTYSGPTPHDFNPESLPRILLVFDPRLEETAATIHGIIEVGHKLGPWAYFFDDEIRAASDLTWLRESRWAGVISRHTTHSMAEACREHRTPLVDLNDSPCFEDIPKIRPANGRIGHIGGEHLWNNGFRSLAFCGYNNVHWSSERCEGFVRATQAEGAVCLVHNTTYPGALSPEWDLRETEELARWLRTLPHPTAIMACHDMRALQILAAAAQAGLRVPEEVAVLGVNNDTIRCELATPSLSSVAHNPAAAGRKAAETLAQLMAGADIAGETLVEPVGVVTRRSTDVLAVPDRGVAAALKYIREHACDGINVEQVLPHAAMSRAQLEKKFREHLGRTPQAEIRRIQVMKIRELLVETELPLKTIAALTGFEYMEYMSFVFKRITGLAPGAYRRSLRNPTGSSELLHAG